MPQLRTDQCFMTILCVFPAFIFYVFIDKTQNCICLDKHFRNLPATCNDLCSHNLGSSAPAFLFEQCPLSLLILPVKTIIIYFLALNFTVTFCCPVYPATTDHFHSCNAQNCNVLCHSQIWKLWFALPSLSGQNIDEKEQWFHHQSLGESTFHLSPF